MISKDLSKIRTVWEESIFWCCAPRIRIIDRNYVGRKLFDKERKKADWRNSVETDWNSRSSIDIFQPLSSSFISEHIMPATFNWHGRIEKTLRRKTARLRYRKIPLIVSHVPTERDIGSESFAKMVWSVSAKYSYVRGNNSSNTLLLPLRHNTFFWQNLINSELYLYSSTSHAHSIYFLRREELIYFSDWNILSPVYRVWYFSIRFIDIKFERIRFYCIAKSLCILLIKF